MMEFKHGELNQDFYEVQIYVVGQNDFALDIAIGLLADEKHICDVDCSISKNEEYIERPKEVDKLGPFLAHGTMQDYRNK